MIDECRPATTALSGALAIYTEGGERLCTAESVAELAGCNVAVIDANVSWGQMPAPLGSVGGTRVWSREVVESWLAPRAANQVPTELDEQIPAELRALRRWTRHDHKRPIMTNGEPAWAMDPPTWDTYADVRASTTGDGLGFVLNGDGIVAIDLAYCVTDEDLSQGARAILDLLPHTYAELSLSGHGVRLFCYADVAEGRRLSSHGVAIQICGRGRFLTVTGKRLPGRPSVLADHEDVVRALLLTDV